MARVTHRAVSARPAKIRAHRNRPYKVIQETVTQDKKKQLNLVTFSKSPPTGFLFIPTGNPNLTQRCKILSRLETSKIFTVSGSLGSRKNSISRESHRIGYHFTRSVVTKACAELGLDINEVQEASHQRNGPLQRILEGDTSGARLIGKTARVELPQEVLNARARDAIKDLFPLIPDRDMQEIVACAFRKGSNKVGTADSLPLARRVQLAVVAHIRHVYTEYDNLLRTGPWIEARKKVEEACVYRLVRWRGDEDTGGNDDLEQIVREVVVISDDESDIDGNVDDLEAEDRDSSVEIISSEEFALQDKSRLQQRAQSLAATNQSQGTFPDSRSLLSMELRHRRSPQLQQKVPVKFDRRGFTRYRAWDQALERYKHDPKTPILVMRDPVRYREEQSHGDRLVMHSLDRPHGISLAAESTHRLP
ncbi:MAG: hypothetical protein M1812_007188 [Candelaria pacifica]|nr:MAG: hypothetical protein M1812_007188 [Candelaria pacifica]